MTNETTASITLPGALLEPSTYPHPCNDIRLIETHLSWLYLTGDFAYKVKKPVHFDFVDFSSADARAFYCAEELRLNRRFAPSLYIDVVGISADAEGSVRIGEPTGAPNVIEHAVKMRQFDTSAQADTLLEHAGLDADELYRFGAELASQHADIPAYTGPYDAVQPMRDNFTTLAGLTSTKPHRAVLRQLREHLESRLAALAGPLFERQEAQQVRECHGDLHLSNMVRLPEGLVAFDCLEFDADLRNIDVMCDIGFLLMDCLVRQRGDLGYAFIDGYLNVSGDYGGARLLPIFADYRSMVRAKVAGLRLEQAPDDTEAQTKLTGHLDWCAARTKRGPGRLIVMNGVSGTGKSYWARQLVRACGAIRLRSDVLRKVQHGISVTASSGAPLGGGLYNASKSHDLYADLAQLAQGLLAEGETVIIDAACLQKSQRRALYAAAREAHAPTTVLQLTGPVALLRERIAKRNAAGGDPSEADAEVLAWQLENQDLPGSDEPFVSVNTAELALTDLLQHLTP